MLDKFRETAITWDKATSRIYSPVTANTSDENGRKLVVQILNGGQVEDLTGAALHLYWETRGKVHDGLDVFKAVDLKKGEFELSYTTGMLSNHGVLNANLVLIDTIGRVVSERFKITVTEGIDDDAIQSSDSFTALTEALAQVGTINNKADRSELLALESTFEQNKVSVEQQLQQKVGGQVKLKPEEFSDEAMALVTGNGTVNVLSIPQDKSVSLRKTTFLTTGKNLFDISASLSEHIISTNTGQPNATPGAGGIVSDLMITPPNTDYTYSDRNGANFNVACSYTSDGTFIPTSVTQAKKTYRTPSNAAYTRIYTTRLAQDIQFEAGDSQTGYEPYGYDFNRWIPIDGSRIKTLEGAKLLPESVPAYATDFIKRGKNLFDKDTRTVGKYINNATGSFAASATYDTTDFIYAQAGKSYVTSHRIRKYLLYNLQKQPVASSYMGDTTDGPFVFTPSEDGFVKISLFAADVNVFQIEEGTAPSAYDSYKVMIQGLSLPDKSVEQLEGDVKLTKNGHAFSMESDILGTPITIETTNNGSENGSFRLGYTSMNGVIVHPITDDITPIRTFYTVGANHGYGVVQVNQSGFTVADLGSQWTDGERTFTLVKVAGNVIQLAPEYTVDENGIVSAATATPKANLTHVSGATNTTTISITGHIIEQLFPSIKDIRVRYLVDGKEVTTDGDYVGKEVRIKETYTIMDYKAIIDYCQANIGSSYIGKDIAGIVDISNTFTYTKGLKCVTSHSLLTKKKVSLKRCGFLQSIALSSSGYTRKRFMPNVLTKDGFDYDSGINLDTYDANLLFTKADLKNPEVPPSYYADWLYDTTGNKKYGFSMGYIIDKTNSKNADRLANSPNYWDMRSTKKSYPVAIENIQLEAGEYLTFSGFRNYMTAEEVGRATILSVAKDSKDTYVYAHYHGPMSGDNTELDKDMGKSITALQSSNLTALNKVVDTEGIALSSDSVVSDGVFKVQ